MNIPDSLEVGIRGRAAVVIGGGPGIGEAIARAFIAAGATTYLADVNTQTAETTAATLGPLARAVRADVLDRESVTAMLDYVTEDSAAPVAVVNLVGVARGKTFDETTDDDWDTMNVLNLRQQYVVAQESMRRMRRHGSYIAIASLNGLMSSPHNVAYGVAKAGLVSLVRSLGVEVAASGVRVNAVAPGVIATPRMQELFERTGRISEFADAVPMKRIGSPDDVAGAVLFLASPLAAYITGQVVSVDGGATVKYPLALLTDA